MLADLGDCKDRCVVIAHAGVSTLYTASPYCPITFDHQEPLSVETFIRKQITCTPPKPPATSSA